MERLLLTLISVLAAATLSSGQDMGTDSCWRAKDTDNSLERDMDQPSCQLGLSPATALLTVAGEQDGDPRPLEVRGNDEFHEPPDGPGAASVDG